MFHMYFLIELVLGFNNRTFSTANIRGGVILISLVPLLRIVIQALTEIIHRIRNICGGKTSQLSVNNYQRLHSSSRVYFFKINSNHFSKKKNHCFLPKSVIPPSTLFQQTFNLFDFFICEFSRYAIYFDIISSFLFLFNTFFSNFISSQQTHLLLE